MSGGARLLVLIVAGTVLLMTVGVGLTAAAIVHGGSVAVDVHDDDGTDVSVHAPAALLDLVLFFVPDHALTMVMNHGDVAFPDDDQVAELAAIEDYVPALRDAWRELADAPDFTMVEVRGDDHLVQVEKQRNRLLIQLTTDDGRFELALPLRTVSRALRKI